MTDTLRLTAPAKINWTLEVLRVRPDGYHELRSVLQTVDLRDIITLRPARDVIIEVSGPEAAPLAESPPESNLACRAAGALRDRFGVRRGVRIALEKRIPVAAGLGGGSSDAAAVLRGLNRLWDLGASREELAGVAATLGSDPPFFVFGGTAALSGRGEQVEPLPDAVAPSIMLATPPSSGRLEKTASMFRALTPDMYGDGDASIGVRETVFAGRALRDEDLHNVFERVTATLQPNTARAMEALRALGHTPHLAGAGPSFFLLLPGERAAPTLAGSIRRLGFQPRVVRPLSRRAALTTRKA